MRSMDRRKRGRVRPSAPRRWGSLLLALLFLGAWGGDIATLVDCPHHAPPWGVEGHTGADETDAEHRHHGAPGGNGDRGPGPSTPVGDTDHPGHDHGPCTCLGDCVGSAAPSGPAPALAGPHLPPAPLSARAPTDAPRPDRLRLSHLLPYATAPPGPGSAIQL
jgi:hypothetical protein